MKRFVALVVFLVFAAVAGLIIYREGSLPVNKNEKTTKIFVVPQGASLNEIARKLASEDLIRNKLVFYLIVKKLGIEKKIQAGDFRLSASMSAEELANALTHGTVDTWITTIEGWRKEEVAQVVSQNFGIPENEFVLSAKEGHLFPDTYLIPKQATTENILSIFYSNFDKRYDDSLKTKARKLGLTEGEVVTIASLVEREARNESERKNVASILLKRLKNDWPLQVDATVQYVIGYQPKEKIWWKKNLSQDDLDIDSPYNTYKNKGLPPGPICSPGLLSIQAVVEADPTTPYWFYLTDPSGKTHYSKTVEEHDAQVNQYLR